MPQLYRFSEDDYNHDELFHVRIVDSPSEKVYSSLHQKGKLIHQLQWSWTKSNVYRSKYFNQFKVCSKEQ